MARQRKKTSSGERSAAAQLEFAFAGEHGAEASAASDAPPAVDAAGEMATAPAKIDLEPAPPLGAVGQTRGRDLQFWPGFMGRRAPAPRDGELPMNTKRAAHYIRRSSRWMEAVRHEENSPPWRKKGGLFEYFASQLDWWQEQLADTW